MTTTRALINKELGQATRSEENRETEAMATTAALVLRADSGRLAFQIINLGSVAVFLRPRGAPTSTLGIRIGPTGGAYIVNYKDDYTLVTLDWFGVTASGTSTLYTVEELLEAGAVPE